MKTYLIIIPQLNYDGPIKGAIALANSLYRKKLNVKLIIYKNINSSIPFLHNSIEVINLDKKANNLYKKIKYYRSYIRNLINQKKNNSIIAISYCLEADLLNYFSLKEVKKICSMRADIFQNYYYNYGLIGYVLAYFHYKIITKFSIVIAMHDEMRKQIRNYYLGKIIIINNFVDEIYLSKFKKKLNKTNIKKIIFVGKLNKRKNPISSINIFAKLLENDKDLRLEIIGTGPLLEQLKERVKFYKIRKFVHFHGFKKNPYDLISDSDILILPSFSEGMSRALIEAQFFGIISVIKDHASLRLIKKGNSNLITYQNSNSLYNSMKLAIKRSRNKIYRKKNLLPLSFSQSYCVDRFVKFIK